MLKSSLRLTKDGKGQKKLGAARLTRRLGVNEDVL
jgi:hypothetical protein